ncbi:phage holin family protein [Nostoc sp.]|uniref:phage holin family protein n=1 Tax=Nostoc sp. TaxID=1180 RepID=UPI002FF866BF
MSFLIIYKLSLDIDIISLSKAAISSVVFGILNAILLSILSFFTFPVIILNLGLFFFVLNTIIFALAAYVVERFRLKCCF